ncbi:hypothetical protein AA313_de0202442 [Arthrobotrys entomopaga]|nr:hypothetical protein AA313_de0202442 [Arthrobotrys entomopaga]
MAARFAFSKQLKELRFHLCQTSAASSSLRSFITKSYPSMKKTNPNIPILIREAQGMPPRVFARYELGKEAQIQLSGMRSPIFSNRTVWAHRSLELSEAEIESKISALVQQSLP